MHSPTALIANNFNNGFWGASSTLTAKYSCIRQYMAILTEIDTTIVICATVNIYRMGVLICKRLTYIWPQPKPQESSQYKPA